LGFWRNGSEKGYTRKHTENRVTSCGLMFLGEFRKSRCFAKDLGMGHLGFWLILRVLGGIPRGCVEEGGPLVFLRAHKKNV
jgi:hypothetical protein